MSSAGCRSWTCPQGCPSSSATRSAGAPVRTTPAGAAADAELKASIAVHGIIENLVLRPAAEGRFAVVAGGRRLEQAQALVEDGVFDGEYPVPCRIQSDAGDAHELSLAENVIRAAMHPADQVVGGVPGARRCRCDRRGK